MDPESALVLLFSVATAVALATRRLKLPYTVGLVLAGLALGSTELFSGIRLTKTLLYALFLPGLLFEAAYHLKFAEFRANARAIVLLAVPGVLVARPRLRGAHLRDGSHRGRGTFPHRDVLVVMTFGAVFLSIVVQGLTAGPLLRRLKLVSGPA